MAKPSAVRAVHPGDEEQFLHHTPKKRPAAPISSTTCWRPSGAPLCGRGRREPGTTAVLLPGHTLGCTGVIFESERKTVEFVGNALDTRLNYEGTTPSPAWSTLDWHHHRRGPRQRPHHPTASLCENGIWAYWPNVSQMPSAGNRPSPNDSARARTAGVPLSRRKMRNGYRNGSNPSTLSAAKSSASRSR